MLNYIIKSLDRFIELAEGIDTPMKFYQTDGNLKAIVDLRTKIVSFEGEKSDEAILKLREAGFVQVEVEETRRSLDID